MPAYTPVPIKKGSAEGECTCCSTDASIATPRSTAFRMNLLPRVPDPMDGAVLSQYRQRRRAVPHARKDTQLEAPAVIRELGVRPFLGREVDDEVLRGLEHLLPLTVAVERGRGL